MYKKKRVYKHCLSIEVASNSDPFSEPVLILTATKILLNFIKGSDIPNLLVSRC